ncbi:MAG: TIGR00341 family protein [Candidatus Caldarchaeum sp.]
MKCVTIRVVEDNVKGVDEAMEALALPYSKSTVTCGGQKCFQYSIVVSEEMVGKIIEQVSQKMDLRRKESIIYVSDLVATVSPYMERLKQSSGSGNTFNPLEAIVERVDRFLKPSREMSIMVALASAVALIGLYLNNPVIIIGAMLLSPLLGPINAVNVNTCLGKSMRVLRGEFTVLLMLGLAILTSTLGAFFLNQTFGIPLNEEIMRRTRMTIPDIALALLLGVGAGLALTTNIPELLVGVAIAAALIPPASVTGIGIALGRADTMVGAFSLTLMNILGLNIGGIITLIARGVRPRKYYEQKKARKYIIMTLLTVTIILVMLVAVISWAGLVS